MARFVGSESDYGEQDACPTCGSRRYRTGQGERSTDRGESGWSGSEHGRQRGGQYGGSQDWREYGREYPQSGRGMDRGRWEGASGSGNGGRSSRRDDRDDYGAEGEWEDRHEHQGGSGGSQGDARHSQGGSIGAMGGYTGGYRGEQGSRQHGRQAGGEGYYSSASRQHFGMGGSYEGSYRQRDEKGHRGEQYAGDIRTGWSRRDFGSRGGRRNRGPKNYTRSDERIREDICDQLMNGDDDVSDVEVKVEGGEVTLSGTVERRDIKYRIEELADEIGGVKDVRNEIRVKRPSQSERESQDTASTGGQHSRSPRKSAAFNS